MYLRKHPCEYHEESDLKCLLFCELRKRHNPLLVHTEFSVKSLGPIDIVVWDESWLNAPPPAKWCATRDKRLIAGDERIRDAIEIGHGFDSVEGVVNWKKRQLVGENVEKLYLISQFPNLRKLHLVYVHRYTYQIDVQKKEREFRQQYEEWFKKAPNQFQGLQNKCNFVPIAVWCDLSTWR